MRAAERPKGGAREDGKSGRGNSGRTRCFRSLTGEREWGGREGKEVREKERNAEREKDKKEEKDRIKERKRKSEREKERVETDKVR